jgi:hypothetical protein
MTYGELKSLDIGGRNQQRKKLKVKSGVLRLPAYKRISIIEPSYHPTRAALEEMKSQARAMP